MNKDFERFELSPKEEKQEKQWKMSVSHLVQSLFWRGELSKRTALAKQHCIWKQLNCKHEKGSVTFVRFTALLTKCFDKLHSFDVAHID